MGTDLSIDQENLDQGVRTFNRVVGVGGIGFGICFELEGNHDLGRSESRPAKLTDARDYCKLHIIIHYLATLLNNNSAPHVHLVPVGKVGADANGVRLLDEMKKVGIDIKHVDALDDMPTLFSVCYQYPDRSGGNITTSNSAASRITFNDLEFTRSLFQESQNRAIALAVPEVPLEIRKQLLQIATESGAFRVGSFTASEMLEAKNSGVFNLLDLVALNAEEASVLVESRFDPANPQAFLESCASAFSESPQRIWIVITAGELGAYGFDGNEWRHSAAVPTTVESTAGAGDALLAGTLSGLALGLPFTAKSTSPESIKSALDLGVLVGSYSVTSRHSIHPRASLGDVLMFARGGGIPRFASQLR